MLEFVEFVRDIVFQRPLFEGSFFDVIGRKGGALFGTVGECKASGEGTKTIADIRVLWGKAVSLQRL